MALQMELTLENGVVLSTAYLRVAKMIFEYKDLSSVEIVLNVYKDQPSYSNGKPEILQLRHKCVSSDFLTYFSQAYLDNVNKNHIRSAYEWLLSLEPYFDAEEV